MNHYVTGAAIKALREKKRLTQQQLAEKLSVSDKAVSKWETGKGFPDISLLEPLASVLQVSLPELLSGEQIINANRSANLLKSNLYVCPVCGNIFHSTGSAMISCCGVAVLSTITAVFLAFCFMRKTFSNALSNFSPYLLIFTSHTHDTLLCRA